jgi:hypothetical protein
MDSANEGSEFESLYGQKLSLLHVVLNGCGVHRSSYPMDTGGPFSGVKVAGA